jgi:3D-(3,5/4)-trihydroxycyclohexane-1,2-dione acylhydrolase (decyclizing)
MTKPNYGVTERLTVGQAVVRFIAAQYTISDGVKQRFIPAAMGIFGHGNVAGLGQALDQYSDLLPFVQGRNEQNLVHAAVGFAKARNRKQTFVVTASIGPGAMNMVTPAALASVNHLPVLLIPGDSYATRRQGPVLQQLEHPLSPDISVNDAFRPVARFFDRITRPEQLLYSLPSAFRVLANPVETGAVVLALPQDLQSHAFDFPSAFFEERIWKIRRAQPDAADVNQVAKMINEAKKPLIIAGGGVIYSEATLELEALANSTGIPVAETFGGKGAVQKPGDWHLMGLGLEGSPETNRLVAEADLIISIGTRLTDFATGSQSMFQNPKVKFASINISEHDAIKQGAVAILADAKLSLIELKSAVSGYTVPSEWATSISTGIKIWNKQVSDAINPDKVFDKKTLSDSEETKAVLTQGQLIGVMNEQAKSGDVIIAAAGGAPGDVQKVWDATNGKFAHLEFGFSCMGYEIPAGIGVRLATPDVSKRVLVFIGDGTFLMAPTELVTACQEGLPMTVVISENHGYQVIRRLQMWRSGRHFGNEFRYRQTGATVAVAAEQGGTAPRLEGDYLKIDLIKMSEGMGARAIYATTANEFRKALVDTRDDLKPVVIVVPTIQHANLPASNVWWDVAPAEVSTQPWVAAIREDYEKGLGMQRWHA